jgi:hypothetical protein
MHGWKDRCKPPQGYLADPAERELDPGQSMKIVLPDWCFDGDGLFCYYVRIWMGKSNEFGSVQNIYVSEPFVIDQFKPAAKSEPSAKQPAAKP